MRETDAGKDPDDRKDPGDPPLQFLICLRYLGQIRCACFSWAIRSTSPLKSLL